MDSGGQEYLLHSLCMKPHLSVALAANAHIPSGNQHFQKADSLLTSADGLTSAWLVGRAGERCWGINTLEHPSSNDV